MGALSIASVLEPLAAEAMAHAEANNHFKLMDRLARYLSHAVQASAPLRSSWKLSGMVEL